MDRITLKHIIKQRLFQLEECITDIQKEFGKDSVHLFRVRVKKLRALLRMLNLKLPGKIKKVYTAAGQIRDIQLQLKQINKASVNSKIPAEYMAALTKQLKKRKAFFSTVSKKNHFAGCRRKLIEKLPQTLSPDTIASYLHNEIKSLQVLAAAGTGNDDYLHTCRKKIKNIIYINEFYNDERKRHRGPAVLDEAVQKRILALAEELGEFIDTWVAVSMLKQDWMNKANRRGQQQLKKIRKQWRQQKQKLRNHVKEELQSGIFLKAIP